MKTGYSKVVCIVDRSGSMNSVRTDSIGGFNAFLEAQKKVVGEADLTLVLFDHEYLVVYDSVPLKDVPPLNSENYVPRGSTALLDAIGKAVTSTGAELSAMDEAERPESVIVAILTDGYENASTEYTRERISEMTKHQQEKYGWEFRYLGANQDAIKVGGSFGFKAKDCVTYASTGIGTREAYLSMSDSVTRCRTKSA